MFYLKNNTEKNKIQYIGDCDLRGACTPNFELSKKLTKPIEMAKI